ncbi:hypothetical protein KC319_g5 [Hortaea werneckii]|nr:hypothetical protein KC319_g5 [Hortaea werneckii]
MSLTKVANVSLRNVNMISSAELHRYVSCDSQIRGKRDGSSVGAHLDHGVTYPDGHSQSSSPVAVFGLRASLAIEFFLGMKVASHMLQSQFGTYGCGQSQARSGDIVQHQQTLSVNRILEGLDCLVHSSDNDQDPRPMVGQHSCVSLALAIIRCVPRFVTAREKLSKCLEVVELNSNSLPRLLRGSHSPSSSGEALNVFANECHQAMYRVPRRYAILRLLTSTVKGRVCKAHVSPHFSSSSSLCTGPLCCNLLNVDLFMFGLFGRGCLAVDFKISEMGKSGSRVNGWVLMSGSKVFGGIENDSADIRARRKCFSMGSWTGSSRVQSELWQAHELCSVVHKTHAERAKTDCAEYQSWTFPKLTRIMMGVVEASNLRFGERIELRRSKVLASYFRMEDSLGRSIVCSIFQLRFFLNTRDSSSFPKISSATMTKRMNDQGMEEVW